MNFFARFFQRGRRDRKLRLLNRANTFQTLQQGHMSDGDIEKLRWRQATADCRQEWRASACVLNLQESAPGSEVGRKFLASLEAGDIHYLAGGIHYDRRFDEDWALAYALHPKCDLGTGWLLLLGSGSPMAIEKYLWENADEKNPFGPFEADVHRNDAIVGRMNDGSFASRDYAPPDTDRIFRYRREMKAALSEGHPLRWIVPNDAFRGMKGLEAKPRFEVSGDNVLESFETWLNRDAQSR
ncbi:hypothetical protein J7426_17640 [Tropicibacter sp. R16_0]|uniref:hypothetical protein n=1 Tax=Tropicibacter sp. R16_0 TaxID=2821102 RepID=UPI001ADC4EB6|nr:hypothetical protein [Tropicibacter sp. R16_0]MBO9452103.1 hypothetical protein [Tropicibacter sp. R16_0]